MAKYVDGFILPIKKSKIKEYEKLAKFAGKIWKEHGALQYVECKADDVKKGKYTSFPRSVKLKSTEVVFFSYIVYKSRAHRDSVNKKVMKDPRFNKFQNMVMPFDAKRMIYGGFKSMVTF